MICLATEQLFIYFWAAYCCKGSFVLNAPSHYNIALALDDADILMQRLDGLQARSYTGRVLFREACSAIPADALVLEIGPAAPLRTLLRQNRPELS